MNSIKELKEQLGYEEIGLDDIFVFHCINAENVASTGRIFSCPRKIYFI